MDWVCWQVNGELGERGVNHLFTSSSVQMDSLFSVGSTLWVSFLLIKQGSFPHFHWSEDRRILLYCLQFGIKKALEARSMV